MSDMLDKEWEIAHVQEFANKQRDARRYNSRVVPRDMKEGDLVLRQVVWFPLLGLKRSFTIRKDPIEDVRNCHMKNTS